LQLKFTVLIGFSVVTGNSKNLISFPYDSSSNLINIVSSNIILLFKDDLLVVVQEISNKEKNINNKNTILYLIF
jgi:hypothetical protein